MEDHASEKQRGRRPAHYFTFFDGGPFSANNDLSAFEETFLPAQYWDLNKPPYRPERALYFAVLEQAIRDFQRGIFSESVRTKRLAREAAAWFLSTDTSWPCSFENICEELGINASYLRKGLIEMGERLAAKKREGIVKAEKLQTRAMVVNRRRVTSKSLQYIQKLPRAS